MIFDMSAMKYNEIIGTKTRDDKPTVFNKLQFYDDLHVLINQSTKVKEAGEEYDCRLSIIKHLHAPCKMLIDDIELTMNPETLRNMYCDNTDNFDRELLKDEIATYVLYITVYNNNWNRSESTQTRLNIKYINDILQSECKETIIKLIEICIGYMVSQEDGFSN